MSISLLSEEQIRRNEQLAIEFLEKHKNTELEALADEFITEQSSGAYGLSVIRSAEELGIRFDAYRKWKEDQQRVRYWFEH